MDERTMKERISRAMDRPLAGLRTDPHLARRVLAGQRRMQRHPIRWKLALCVVVFVAFITLPLVGQRYLQRQWITGASIEDGQIYDLYGHMVDPDLIDHAVADIEWLPVNTHISSDKYEDVAQLPGVAKVHPAYMPDTASPYEYHYDVLSGMVSYLERYLFPGDDSNAYSITYNCCIYQDPWAVAGGIEQNEEGYYETIDGRNVYFTWNYERIVVVWTEGLTSYLISGPISKEEAVKVMRSVEGGI